MYSDILSTIRTSSERDLLNDEISLIKQSAYETKKEETEMVLKTKVRSTIANLINTGSQKAGNTKKYLEGLEGELKKLAEIKIVLASEPTESLIGTMHQWLEEKVQKGLVMDIDIDKHILGGAQISFNGKYFDGSLAKKIDELQIS